MEESMLEKVRKVQKKATVEKARKVEALGKVDM